MSKSEARLTPASSLVIFLSRFSVFPSSDDEKSKTEFHFKIESAGAARPPAASALLQPRGATPVCAAPPSLRTLRAGNVEGLATQRASVYVRRWPVWCGSRTYVTSCHETTRSASSGVSCAHERGGGTRVGRTPPRARGNTCGKCDGGVTLPLAAHPRVGLAAPRATNPALCAWL